MYILAKFEGRTLRNMKEGNFSLLKMTAICQGAGMKGDCLRNVLLKRSAALLNLKNQCIPQRVGVYCTFDILIIC